MKKYFFLLFNILFVLPAWATHNRAGEITYKQLSVFDYGASIVVYAKTSANIPRPSLVLNWGDGTSDTIPQISVVSVGNDTERREYYGVHTYSSFGTYVLWFEDPNRNGGVVNIPNSDLIPFYVETKLILSPFWGFNNSPVLLQPPIDEGCSNRIFIHNPNAYDPDGDSLSYELVFCKGSGGLPIPGYYYPVGTISFSLDAITGDLIWNTPGSFCGEYNVAFLIKEWRNGQVIGYVERDMQITIICNCNNNDPPIIANLLDTCIEAGDTLVMAVSATDLTLPSDNVTLTATGSPFLLQDNSVSFPQPVSGLGGVTDTFIWYTNCSHVKKAAYQVTFKAEDGNTFANLVDLETVRITVVAPAPQNPVATPLGNGLNLSWNVSPCTNAIGYKLYRHNGFVGYVHGYCETGVPAYTGYTLLDTIGNVMDTTYRDDNNGAGLTPGQIYCYMVVALFADGAESYASEEFCAQLIRDLPVITNISINTTSTTNGTVYVAWSSPKTFDSTQIPGPYKYLLYRSADFFGGAYTLIDSFPSLYDTIYVDTLHTLNTSDNPYSYKVEFINDSPGNRFLVGSTQNASSVYLTVSPTDNANNLSWEEHVPWTNTGYVVYKQNISLQFDSIASVTGTTYADTGLINGVEYCYMIKSVGGYSGGGFVDPIINFSEQKCATPIDNVPPCPPELTVEPNCLEHENVLVWNNPNNSCADDVMQYQIYFSPGNTDQYVLIATMPTANDTVFIHTGLVTTIGCYKVLAVDSTGNASQDAIKFCVDSCREYHLPNIFTPDGDNVNDLFHPCDETTDLAMQKLCPPYQNIRDVKMRIFNRWGQLVFETTDLNILWNGKIDNTGAECPDGVYYYVCDVNEIYLVGIKTRVINGFVHVLRKP